jgi:hypothetical protein
VSITRTETKYEATRTETVITCDLCQATAKDGAWNGGYGSDYQHDEVTIECGHHEHYPGSGSYEKVIYDCCPKCFTEKVAPALEALGLKPRKDELDF